jgi:hypothetical protein
MDYMNPEFEEWMARFRESSRDPTAFEGFPGSVADAINILRHEKIGRWESRRWGWVEAPNYDRTAKKVGNGAVDHQKQDALYVRLNALGGVTSTPTQVDASLAEIAGERADRFRQLVVQLIEKDTRAVWRYEKVQDAFRELFRSLGRRGVRGRRLNACAGDEPHGGYPKRSGSWSASRRPRRR